MIRVCQEKEMFSLLLCVLHTLPKNNYNTLTNDMLNVKLFPSDQLPVSSHQPCISLAFVP